MSKPTRQELVEIGKKAFMLRIYEQLIKSLPDKKRAPKEIEEQIEVEHKLNEMFEEYFGVPCQEIESMGKKEEFDSIIAEINASIKMTTTIRTEY